MNTPDRNHHWIDLNQKVMVAEFARLKQRLGAHGDPDSLEAAARSSRADMPAPAAIDHLADTFGLSHFERDLLLLCAGVEMDSGLADLCMSAGGDPAGRAASFRLALSALDGPHWSALAPTSPLRSWRLLEIDDSNGFVQGRLRIDERVLHYLAGLNYLDTRLRSLLRPAACPIVMADSHATVSDAVCRALEATGGGQIPLVWLAGDDAAGQVDVAARVSAAHGRVLHVMPVHDMPGAPVEIDALVTLWCREAALSGSSMLVSCGGDPVTPSALRFIDRVQGLVFVGAAQPQPIERSNLHFRVDKPDAAEQKRLWQRVLGDCAIRLNGSLDAVAGQFRLSARTICTEAAQLGPLLADDEHPDGIMWTACRALGRARLDELALRIDAFADWSDLILPEVQSSTLRQIASHVRNRLKVHVDWGFAERGGRGLGITALFAGESGTGKTMAAEVLARDLQLDLYRIDLSAVVSKYIGETEKNLRRVFDAAEDNGAILLFDEADALFGKRSEVKDSHDRYANIEVSYLLQRMEAYRGLAILTTNQKAALDGAFLRRLGFVVHFPFPDQAQREAIWQDAFPARMPREALDYGKLARLGVSGGSIRNIALNAGFRAAALNQPVSMAHLLHAARHEAAKRERSLSDAETRGWI